MARKKLTEMEVRNSWQTVHTAMLQVDKEGGRSRLEIELEMWTKIGERDRKMMMGPRMK